jgi:hypothetical protein
MGLPFHKQNLYPSTLVFWVSCIVNNNTLLEQFFMQKKQEKGSFWSSSPIHDIRLTSRGGPSNHILIYPHLTAEMELKFVISRLGCIVLITSLQLLLLFSSAAVWAKF